MSTVIDTVVQNGFCCGCGTCAGLCPHHVISMKWNHYGEYTPVCITECTHDCGLCIKVCPFYNGNRDEDAIGKDLFGSLPGVLHLPETGYYIGTYVGAVSDNEHRLRSASGGLATWFMTRLLLEKKVDAVICVHHATDDRRLFQFVVSESVQDIVASAGSVYYPVEYSEMIQYIKEHDKHYAIVGLPCLIKGLRLAQEKNKLLKDRVVVTIGLACANMKSTHFTQYAAWRSGLKDDVAYVSFRNKTQKIPVNFFNFYFGDRHRNKTSMIWNHEIWSMYTSRCLSLHSCDCCDDIFAECADVCFMDAWIPLCKNEHRGTSIALTRSMLSDSIIQNGFMTGELVGKDVSVRDTIEGQSAVRWKREILKYRLLLMEKRGEKYPQKRVPAAYGSMTILERDSCRKALLIQRESRVRFDDGFEAFRRWFNVEYKNRPFLIMVYYTIRSIAASLYHKMKKDGR